MYFLTLTVACKIYFSCRKVHEIEHDSLFSDHDSDCSVGNLSNCEEDNVYSGEEGEVDEDEGNDAESVGDNDATHDNNHGK